MVVREAKLLIDFINFTSNQTITVSFYECHQSESYPHDEVSHTHTHTHTTLKKAHPVVILVSTAVHSQRRKPSLTMTLISNR